MIYYYIPLVLMVFFPLPGGFYTVVIKPGLRLISLNTVYYYTNDKLTADLPDPAGQFGWLDGVLTNASVTKQQVLSNLQWHGGQHPTLVQPRS